jgi:hypothetical protein
VAEIPVYQSPKAGTVETGVRRSRACDGVPVTNDRRTYRLVDGERVEGTWRHVAT